MVSAAHGVPKFISEKFRQHSDGYNHYMCRCGRPAIVNPRRSDYICRYCGDNADIFKIPTTWSSKSFFQILDSMNVGVEIKPKPLQYFNYESTDSKSIK